MDLILFSLVAGILATLVRGYQFGVGNQVEQLPLVMRAMDSSFLINDFFTNAGSVFGPRFYFVKLIAFLASLISLPWVYLSLTFLANVLVAWVTAKTAGLFFRGSSLAGRLAAVAVLSIESIQLGGATMLVSAFLTSQILAMPLALWSINLGLRGFPIGAAIWAGLASLIHPLVGVEVGVTMILVMIWQSRLKPVEWRRIGWAAMVLGGFVLGWLVPSLRYQDELMTNGEFVEVLAYYRDPHHYLASSWPWQHYLDLFGFLAAFGACWHWWQKKFRPQAEQKWRLVLVMTVILVLCLAGYLFIEVVPTRFGTMTQPFRLLFIVKWLGLILAAGMAAQMINRVDGYLLMTSLLSPVTMGMGCLAKAVRRIKLGWVLPVMMVYFAAVGFSRPREVLLLAVLMLAALGWRFKGLMVVGTVALMIFLFGPYPKGVLERFRPRVYLRDNLTSEMAAVGEFARTQTPKEAIFLTPFNFGQFRIAAERAMVIDWKSFPFYDRQIVEWQQRIANSYGPDPAEFEENYRKIDKAKLVDLQSKYKIAYAVLDKETAIDLPILFESDQYKIVQVTIKK